MSERVEGWRKRKEGKERGERKENRYLCFPQNLIAKNVRSFEKTVHRKEGKILYGDRNINSSPPKQRIGFPSLLSLKKKREFERVYKNGRRYWNKTFVIYIMPNKINITRLGLTVSKKVGKSVKRNRVKRLIRESFRLSQEQIMPGYDIVVVAQSCAYGLKCQQARLELLSLLRRGGIVSET